MGSRRITLFICCLSLILLKGIFAQLSGAIDKLGSEISGAAKKTKEATKSAVNSTVEKVEDTAKTIGEKVSDAIPGLWYHDDDGNLVKLTLEIPAPVDLGFAVDDRVFFTLHTRSNPQGEQLIVNDTERLKSSRFDAKKDSIFVTHGWLASNKSKICTLIRDAYLQHGDYNVIVVDWSAISKRPYGWAQAHVKKVGQYVASMVNFLVENGMQLNNTKLIGHSLGAHVMGLAGYSLHGKVNYIVGMDPALPLFNTAAIDSRISPESGQNVEVIHTNAGLLGLISPAGHADFYPNGGTNQIGCGIDPTSALTCSHGRSYEYYAESINNPKVFHAKKCDSHLKVLFDNCKGVVVLMGGPRKKLDFRGAYYLETNETPPFGKGKVV